MSLTIQHQVSLADLNTLAVPSRALHFVSIEQSGQIPEAIAWARSTACDWRVLGEGSNLLLAGNIRSLVMAMRIRGRERLTINAQGEETWRFCAGENWHQAVLFSIEQGLSGLENLALIPGLVGAAPVQNIGAYGVELAQLLVGVQAYDTRLDDWCYLNTDACEFDYRDSVFKRQPGRYVISAVDLCLQREFKPQLEYGPLQSLRQKPGLTAADVMTTVIATRQAKLPDPGVLPNAGSFFKNPIVDTAKHQQLVEQRPDLVAYPLAGQQWKLAAGWLIDQAGLRGKHNDAGVGCYHKQALVLVNPRKADTSAILDWQHQVQQRVLDTFGVTLEPEPGFWQ